MTPVVTCWRPIHMRWTSSRRARGNAARVSRLDARSLSGSGHQPDADGEAAARFEALADRIQKAPRVTRDRLVSRSHRRGVRKLEQGIDRLARVSGNLLYLPLDQLACQWYRVNQGNRVTRGSRCESRIRCTGARRCCTEPGSQLWRSQGADEEGAAMSNTRFIGLVVFGALFIVVGLSAFTVNERDHGDQTAGRRGRQVRLRAGTELEDSGV